MTDIDEIERANIYDSTAYDQSDASHRLYEVLQEALNRESALIAKVRGLEKQAEDMNAAYSRILTTAGGLGMKVEQLEKGNAGLVSVIVPHAADLERMKGVFTEHGKGCFESTIVEIDKAIAEFRQAIKQHGGEQNG